MTTAMRDVPRSEKEEKRQGAAIVVGASLAGLMTALALSHAGVDVTMLERSGAAPRARKGLLSAERVRASSAESRDPVTPRAVRRH